MIVLDEQLLGRGLEKEIERWYAGRVRFVIDLRPGTVIKDEAIPALLRSEREPTFVTINVSDFWLKVEPDMHFCVVCIAVPDNQSAVIPDALRRLFRLSAFSTKAARMETVIRVAGEAVTHYSVYERRMKSAALPSST